MEAPKDQWATTAAKIAVATMVIIVVAVVVINSDIAGKGGQQFTNTNMAAPFSALGFLAGAAMFIVGIIVAIAAFASGHKLLARSMTIVVATEVALYAALLIGYSALSKEVVLARGAEKYFCELDCHIGYAVTDVRRDGDVLTVALRTRFDEKTIAPWRGDSPLTPNARQIVVVDGSGRMYAPRRTEGPELTSPLRPGQSYTTDFSFELNPGALDPRLLLLAKATFPERVMIGNENSFLHKIVSFRL